MWSITCWMRATVPGQISSSEGSIAEGVMSVATPPGCREKKAIPSLPSASTSFCRHVVARIKPALRATGEPVQEFERRDTHFVAE